MARNYEKLCFPDKHVLKAPLEIAELWSQSRGIFILIELYGCYKPNLVFLMNPAVFVNSVPDCYHWADMMIATKPNVLRQA